MQAIAQIIMRVGYLALCAYLILAFLRFAGSWSGMCYQYGTGKKTVVRCLNFVDFKGNDFWSPLRGSRAKKGGY